MAPLKGKKAWRKNIDASEIEDALASASHQQRRGPAVESLKDSELFFVDTTSEDGVHARTSASKKQGKKLQLRSEAIVNQAHKAKPVTTHRPPRKVNGVLKKGRHTKRTPQFGSVPEAELDIWSGADADALAAAAAAPSSSPASLMLRRKSSRPKLKPNPLKVKAVEIDAAGCSYNPEPEAHQESLAALVAAEMKRQLRQELLPTAPPKLVSSTEMGDELAQLQVEEEAGNEDENEIALSDSNNDSDDDVTATKGKKNNKKTQKDRNRERRRQDEDVELQERRRLKQQRRDLENLDALKSQLEQELAEREHKRQRRQHVQAEKAAAIPPRLGPHRFEPSRVQVATTDELGGSLRTVKPDAMVARDRYKSLQHRGLIEPRKLVTKRTRRRVEYEKGARTEKALAAQAEIEGLQRARKEAKKTAKKAAYLADM
uniref:Ribosome biogenesis protein NOP53 n=1 Tax=Chlamydomonas euryale TaxID=1486919 RepID=A0A7R9VJW7_9CHLO|mmetsp:Transcript_37652/g.111373  ORF Transcript_37652/g.111373 Transcript_37652/m.111373 type:complete len:431 (+) Transcript_37652:546-1838(+)